MRPRQILPPVFRRAGSFYISKRDVIFFRRKSLISEPCYGHVVNYESGIDIDSISDLHTVRYLYDEGTIN